MNPCHLLQWHRKRIKENEKGRWQKKKADLWLQSRQQGSSQNQLLPLYPQPPPLFHLLVCGFFVCLFDFALFWFCCGVGFLFICLILFSFKHFLLEPALPWSLSHHSTLQHLIQNRNTFCTRPLQRHVNCHFHRVHSGWLKHLGKQCLQLCS